MFVNNLEKHIEEVLKQQTGLSQEERVTQNKRLYKGAMAYNYFVMSLMAIGVLIFAAFIIFLIYKFGF